MVMAISSAIIPAIANVIGGQQTNQSNDAEARMSRMWQENMRASAYQTTVADLKAAGLNPMLAYSQGANQTPGTQMAVMKNYLGDAATSAVQGYNSYQQAENYRQAIEQSKAQTEQIRAQAALTAAQEANTRIDAAMKEAQTKYWNVMVPRVMADTKLSAASKAELEQRVRNAKLTGFLTIKQSDSADLRNALMRLQLNQSKAYSDYFGSPMGQAHPYVESGLTFGNSAASMFKPGGVRIDKSGSSYNYSTTNYEVP